MRRLALGAAAVLAAGAGALGLLTGGGAPAGADGGPAAAARQDAMQHFAVFRAAHRGAPADPAVAASATRAGIDPSEARAADVPLGAPSVTVLPRQEALCVYVDGSAYGCAPWDDALAGRTYLTLSGGPGRKDGEALVVGIVPDGAGDVVLHDAGGAAHVATSDDGVYVARARGAKALTLTAPSGATETIDLGGLPGGGQ